MLLDKTAHSAAAPQLSPLKTQAFQAISSLSAHLPVLSCCVVPVSLSLSFIIRRPKAE
jgi:hypothetical protein